VKSYQQLKPNVVLLDIKMPIMNGIETAKIIRQKSPNVGILALTSLEDNGRLQQMMEVGADSYLLKTASIDEIANAIRVLYQEKKKQSN
jgi:DNA-binding NarL/FixJ family response regulator